MKTTIILTSLFTITALFVFGGIMSPQDITYDVLYRDAHKVALFIFVVFICSLVGTIALQIAYWGLRSLLRKSIPAAACAAAGAMNTKDEFKQAYAAARAKKS